MKTYYSVEKNVQILIALLKAHGIRKIVVSPGTTNICLVASLQFDSYFELYSSADERSAAYMACGLAAESKEPVAISCTGATASRNYIPALTEAYYRKLPVLAITSTRSIGQIGQNIDQVIDRTQLLNDIARKSVQIPMPYSEEDIWECNVKINTALIELRRHGGGPVHINLTTVYNPDFSVKELPLARAIQYYTYGDELPSPPSGKIGIFVGAHLQWTDELTAIVDLFCEKYNAVVLTDQTSNYRGKYGVWFNMIIQQKMSHPAFTELDMMIHIGDISASYYGRTKQIWRINPDGEVRDTFKSLSAVFEMDEAAFFSYYVEKAEDKNSRTDYYDKWNLVYNDLIEKAKCISDAIPFSNAWIAQQIHSQLPENCILHLGILNSLRCWNMYKIKNSICSYSNTGGFGIDGGISSLLGASLVHPNKLYFGVVGDLAFFYDMNAIGNRHVGNNIRLMVINNGLGTEFKNKMNLASKAGIGDDVDAYIAAAGHYGQKSRELVKHYAQDLGFIYFSAASKEEFLEKKEMFLQDKMLDKSVLFEVFTYSQDETEALELLQTLDTSPIGVARSMAKNILGEEGIHKIKKYIRGV